MSIQTEIERLQQARNTIQNKTNEFGITSSGKTEKLDALAEKISNITVQTVPSSVSPGESIPFSEGYYKGGSITISDNSGDYLLQESKTWKPTKEEKTITADAGYYGLRQVVVEAIPDNYQDTSSTTATASTVLSPYKFVNTNGDIITGEVKNIGAVSKVLTAADSSYTVPIGYHNGNGKVSISFEPDVTVTPKTTQQEITATSATLQKVIVEKIPVNYGDATGKTVTASDMFYGVTAVGINAKGEAVTVTGTMEKNTTSNMEINPVAISPTNSVTLSGYYENVTVSISNDLETKLSQI